ncbi:MAG: hypothetical protein QG551_169 [Patescibacteria group bacterium]|nr:hypothetical protein [Patescibacteria group bacterium]
MQNVNVKNERIVAALVSNYNSFQTAGNPRLWRKKFRNKIGTSYGVFHEHCYETPEGVTAGQPWDPEKTLRVYTNTEGYVIWAIGPEHIIGIAETKMQNCISVSVNKKRLCGPATNGWQNHSWIGWRRSFKRSFSDTKFLLTFERTREDFLRKVTEGRETYLLYTSNEVEAAVQAAVREVEFGSGRARIGTYSGPASLSIEELKALGVKVCHRPPTKKHPEMAPGDYVSENFNWGAPIPKEHQWFRYGAGYHYHGTVGCNAGWVWYD